jgi:hypothetical protein
MKARGTDKRGQGGAAATIVNTLSEHDGATRVDAATDFTITGRLARFGRGGMMEDISNRLLRDFSTCLQSRLADTPAAPSGAEVSAGDAPPEAVAAAAGEDGHMDAEAAAASAGATTAGTAAGPVSGRPAPPPAPPPAQPEAAKPVGGLGLFFSVLWERIRRRFGSSRGR